MDLGLLQIVSNVELSLHVGPITIGVEPDPKFVCGVHSFVQGSFRPQWDRMNLDMRWHGSRISSEESCLSKAKKMEVWKEGLCVGQNRAVSDWDVKLILIEIIEKNVK